MGIFRARPPFFSSQRYIYERFLCARPVTITMQFKLSFHRLCLAPKFIWGSIKKQTLASPGFSVPVSPRHCRGLSFLRRQESILLSFRPKQWHTPAVIPTEVHRRWTKRRDLPTNRINPTSFIHRSIWFPSKQTPAFSASSGYIPNTIY